VSRVFLLTVALVGACAARGGTPAPEAAVPEVVLRPQGRPEVRVKVELARTPEEHMRGLMYREKMEPDRGMLFIFPEEKQQGFWMKNTYIPLDIMFIKSNKTVLGTAENCEPLSIVTRSVPGDSQFVLEVVGGFAAAHGIGPGTPVEFVHVK
jgi:uncharacterized membrane protein (UPF0127 family)